MWAWVAEFPVQPAATSAIPATEPDDKGELSHLSQLPQLVADVRATVEGGRLSQVSRMSQPVGVEGAHGSGGDRETFKERAATIEFDGAMLQAAAERRASAAHPPTDPDRWRGEGLDLGDLRPCLWCRNLSPGGRCLAAWRGEMRASRDYSPTFPGQPQRCIGYSPPADDPDQRPGRERWPEMIEWQARSAN